MTVYIVAVLEYIAADILKVFRFFFQLFAVEMPEIEGVLGYCLDRFPYFSTKNLVSNQNLYINYTPVLLED